MIIVSLSGKVGVAQDLVFQVESVLELIRAFNRRTRLGATFIEIIKAAFNKQNLVFVGLLRGNLCLLHTETFL